MRAGLGRLRRKAKAAAKRLLAGGLRRLDRDTQRRMLHAAIWAEAGNWFHGDHTIFVHVGPNGAYVVGGGYDPPEPRA